MMRLYTYFRSGTSHRVQSSKTMIDIAAIRLMLNRFAPT